MFLGLMCECISFTLRGETVASQASNKQQNANQSIFAYVSLKDLRVFLWRLETAIRAANCRLRGKDHHSQPYMEDVQVYG